MIFILLRVHTLLCKCHPLEHGNSNDNLQFWYKMLSRQAGTLSIIRSYLPLPPAACRLAALRLLPPGDPPRRQDEGQLDDRESGRDERKRPREALEGGAVEEPEEGDSGERQQGLRERQHRVDLAHVLAAHNLEEREREREFSVGSDSYEDLYAVSKEINLYTG